MYINSRSFKRIFLMSFQINQFLAKENVNPEFYACCYFLKWLKLHFLTGFAIKYILYSVCLALFYMAFHYIE